MPVSGDLGDCSTLQGGSRKVLKNVVHFRVLVDVMLTLPMRLKDGIIKDMKEETAGASRKRSL
jgi:hypothetical protein